MTHFMGADRVARAGAAGSRRPVALCLAIVAIAYRDLGSSPAAETAPEVRFAR